MSDVIARTIDVSFDVEDVNSISLDVRTNKRSIDVEILVEAQDSEVSFTQVMCEKSVDISMKYFGLSVNMDSYTKQTQDIQVIIDSFIQGPVGKAGKECVQRVTLDEYQALADRKELDLSSFYFVTNIYDNLRYIYAGEMLIARSNEDGSFSFPYTFPLTF